MSHSFATAEELFNAMKGMPPDERARFFTLLGSWPGVCARNDAIPTTAG